MSVPNYSRGGFAPRRGRGGNRSFTKQREPPKLDIRKHPLGELLQTFRNADLEVPNLIVPDESFISDCQYVASYNWLDDELPTIIVPGKCFVSLYTSQCKTNQASHHGGLPYRLHSGFKKIAASISGIQTRPSTPSTLWLRSFTPS